MLMTLLVDLYLAFDLFIRINYIKRVKIICRKVNNKLYMGLNTSFHPFYVILIKIINVGQLIRS